MIYAINIYSGPNSQSSKIACDFAIQLLSTGHSIYRLFFFGDGVNNLMTSNNSLAREWQRLATDHQIETVACVASLKKRHPAAEKHPADHLLHNTTVAGLGQYIDALQQADRVVNFGG